ncbi:hypothetical protein [Paraburkholderia sp. C35]|uniref:hypothetical protein n=1 Tax=Paraburkholderia sp. C35 TaxID=2126993 RepID=UPI0013A55625|nr:hypothetical protein [Paraburkholderia sp. C35]
MTTTLKTCTYCLITKPAEGNFYRQRNGYRSICKACVAMQNARYRTMHAEETKAYGAAWREKNPDYQKQWQEANPDKVKAYGRKRGGKP